MKPFLFFEKAALFSFLTTCSASLAVADVTLPVPTLNGYYNAAGTFQNTGGLPTPTRIDTDYGYAVGSGSYGSLSSNVFLADGNSYTFAMSMKFTTDEKGIAFSAVVANGNGLLVRRNGAESVLFVFGTSAQNVLFEVSLTNPESFHHYAFVADSAAQDVKIYLDGALVSPTVTGDPALALKQIKHFQWGNMYGGMSNSPGGSAGLTSAGAHILTLEGYQAALDADQVALLYAQSPFSATDYTATISGDVNFSEIAWDGDKVWSGKNKSDTVTLTAADGTRLTLDGSGVAGKATITSPGTFSLATAANGVSIGAWDLSGVTEFVVSDAYPFAPAPAQLSRSPAKWLYTKTSNTSINTANGNTYEINAGTEEARAQYAFTYNGGTIAFPAGVYAYSSNRTATETTLIFSGATLYADTFDISTMHVTLSTGTLFGTRFITTQGSGNGNTMVQTGGDIILSGTGGADKTGTATLMFGHWPNGKSTYTLSGGSIQAEAGGFRLSNDSPVDFTVSGGSLRVKEIKGSGTQTTTFLLSGGIVEIGSGGFDSLGNTTFTLAGGHLNAFADNGIRMAVQSAAETQSTLSAANGTTMTVSGALSGSGAITIGTETENGSVLFTGATASYTGTMTLATGTAEIPSSFGGRVITAPDTELRVRLTNIEISLGCDMENVTLQPGQNIAFLNPDGTLVTTGTISGNSYAPPVKTWVGETATWSTGDDPANWDDAAAFANADDVLFPASEAPYTVTIDGAVSPANMTVSGATTFAQGQDGAIAVETLLLKVSEGNVEFAVPVTTPKIEVNNGTLTFSKPLGNSGSFGNATLINSTGTLAFDVAADSAQTFTVGNRTGSGTFLKTGEGTLTMTGTNAGFSGTTRVTNGTLLFSGGGANGPGKGSIIEIIGENSLLHLTGGDATGWEKSGNQRLVLSEGGTMRVAKRDTLATNLEMTGGIVDITAKNGENSGRGLDLFGNTIHVKAAANASPEAPTVSRFTGTAGTNDISPRSGGATFTIDENAQLHIAPNIKQSDANAGIVKNGPGRLILEGSASYNATTRLQAGTFELRNKGTITLNDVIIDSGATLEMNPADGESVTFSANATGTGALTHTGAGETVISGVVSPTNTIAVAAGRLTITGGLGTLADTTYTYPLALSIAEGATLTISTGSNIQRMQQISGAGTVEVKNGTLASAAKGGENGFSGAAAPIILSEGGTLLLDKLDVTGWASKTPIYLGTGSTLKVTRRETLTRPLNFQGGTLQILGIDTNSGRRSLDLFSGMAFTVTEDSRIEGVAGGDTYVSNGTESSTTIGNVNNPVMALRNGGLTVAVAENKTLTIAASMISINNSGVSTPYSFTKTGTGTILLDGQELVGDDTGYNGRYTFSNPSTTTIEAGTFILNAHQENAGSYTVATGAALGGNGKITLATGTSLTLNTGSTIIKTTDDFDAALTIEGSVVLPEIQTPADRIRIEVPEGLVKPGIETCYILKGTGIPEESAEKFVAPDKSRVFQDETGIYISSRIGILVTIF